MTGYQLTHFVSVLLFTAMLLIEVIFGPKHIPSQQMTWMMIQQNEYDMATG
jgi:hypothetical protein